MKHSLLCILGGLFLSIAASAQNPYLPMWEYIPDGEPYVFEDPDNPGKYRVYIYGSHDNMVTAYCGRDQVAWSAPVEDLSAWRYEGIIFKSVYDAKGNLLHEDGRGDVLYAPDVTMKINANGKKEYYLYPNNQEGGRNGMAARSDRPDGPFVVCNWSKNDPRKVDGILGFDPAVFVDDDGRVYGYWGFGTPHMAEFDPETMCTVKPGAEIIKGFLTGEKDDKGVDRFYEASSMRKIGDKYVFIYSRKTLEGEFGLPACNYSLAYAYGDSPLGPFTYGGTIIDGRARGVDDDGKVIATACPYGNTHGSLCEINGQWWVFYHRQTGTDEYSRQAMVAPVEVKVEKGKGGKVTISEAEFNSEGFRTEGLDPYAKTPAGWACYLVNPGPVGQKFPNFFFTGSYIQPTRLDTGSYQGPFSQKQPFCPVVNNTSGSTVGYKYFNFDKLSKADKISLHMHVVPQGVDGTITVLVGGPSLKRGGKVVGTFSVSADAPQSMTEIKTSISSLKGFGGKQGLYFIFSSKTSGKSICELHDFQFTEG